MIVDFNESGFPGQFHTDICIIGSGAAGITIVREFLNSSYGVILVEGGGRYAEQQSDQLYRCEGRWAGTSRS